MTEDTTSHYSTRDEFIDREIIAAIEASGVIRDARRDYDVDAIADEVIDSEMRGPNPVFFQRPDVDFWAIVQAHELPAD